MDNILYLDDYINLYNKRDNKLIIYKPYKKTLKVGHIINSEKFLKSFRKLLDKNDISNKILSSSISVVINSSYNIEDKKLITTILEELNYKKITFINEINYFNLSKNTVLINCNYSYYILYYLDQLGNVSLNIVDYNIYNFDVILKLLGLLHKKIVILYGKNYQEIENILKKKGINYYFYEEYSNLIIHKLISK